MTARVLDGTAIAQTIRTEVAAQVAKLSAQGQKPGLAAVLVGEDPASAVYVRSKGKACEEAGMHSVTLRLPANTNEAELLETVDRLNADQQIHGILVQLPLPKHINSERVLRRIDPIKDVDGFHPVNVGKLVVGDRSAFRPATPYGVQQMLIRSGIETRGAHAVIVGRSNIVGRPMANLLIQQGPGGDATVTVCHSKTRDLAATVGRADLLVAAVGRPEMVRGEWVKPGAVVIDVGINRTAEGKLLGDVEYAAAAARASAITPVPGGVGPMTIAMLLANTVTAAKLRAAR